MAGTSIVFLNSWEASTELMDKRSLIYSDRYEVLSVSVEFSDELMRICRPVDGMVMLRELYVFFSGQDFELSLNLVL